MIGILKARSTHSDRLERWMGDNMADISHAMLHGGGKDVRWYGRPIPVLAPGNVRAGPDGDFIGPIRVGGFASAADWEWERRHKIAQMKRQLGAVALADIVGNRWKSHPQVYRTSKIPGTAVQSAVYSLAQMGNQPANMGGASAAPGGRQPTKDTTGAIFKVNPTKTGAHERILSFRHCNLGGTRWSLLYDRIFDVAKTMSSTGTESVTGAPARYQATSQSSEDYAADNFLIIEVVTALGNTAHNWTVCTYTDQNGNTGATLPSVTGVAQCVAGRLDFTNLGQWFCPLAADDIGIQQLDQMQCSASVTGAVNFAIGHPLAWGANDTNVLAQTLDNILGGFNMARIFDDACLCLLGIMNSSSGSLMQAHIETVALVP